MMNPMYYDGNAVDSPASSHQTMRRILSIRPVPKKRGHKLSERSNSEVISTTEKQISRSRDHTSKNLENIDSQINWNASKSEPEFYRTDQIDFSPVGGESHHSLEKTDSDVNAKTIPSLMLRKETCSELRQLENSQKQLESSMYHLLNLTKDLRKHELRHGPTPEIDKRRRVEITKILQTLRLQKKNSEKQNELLRNEISTITRSLLELQKQSQRLNKDNINMKAMFIEYGINPQTCQTQKTKGNTHKDNSSADDNTRLSRLRGEIRKCMSDNHFLKEYVKKLILDLKEKTLENEKEKEISNRLREIAEKPQTNDSSLQRQVMSTSTPFGPNRTGDNSNTGDSISIHYDHIHLKHTELLREYEHLKRLYFFENDQRKTLTNELQEILGNIRVMCRCRPSESPCQFNFISTNRMVPRDQSSLPNWKSDEGDITFNRVFPPAASQNDVFDEIKPLIVSCLDGYNVCLMAYGPTGSGKTFTMQGVRGNPGMTVLAVHELCELCQKMRGPWTVNTSVSMMEVYNEVIYDLLHKDLQPVRLSDDGVDVKVVDAEVKPALTKPEFLYWIGKGHARRRIASTKLNIGSSRSHLVIQIHIDMQSNLDDSKRSSTLVFCDLAGSENIERIEATGNRAVETGFINKSLATLSRVFESLRTHSAAIPYRDSKLTHLLKPSLSGQAKCVLIISISGEASVYEKNTKAIEFGLKVMQISVGKIKKNIKIVPPSKPSLHNSTADKCNNSHQQRF